MSEPRLRRTILASAALAAAAWAQAPAVGDSRPARSIAELLRELDADDFARREAAAEELARRGPEAAAALEAAKGEGSLERRLRVEALLAKLGTKAAPASRPLARATIDLKGATLREACAALGAATRRVVRTAAPGDGERIVDFSCVDAPFFVALDLLAAAAGATTYRDARDGAYVLRAGAEKPGPTTYAEGVRVALTSLSVTRSTRFGSPAQSSAYVQAQVDADPESGVLGILAPVAVLEAVDDRGRSVAPKERQQVNYVQRIDPTGRMQVAAMLTPPEADAKTIKTLRLDLRTIVPEEIGEVEITSLKADPEGFVGDGALRVAVVEWTEGEDGVTVRVAIERPVAEGDAPPNSNLSDDQVTVVRTDGVATQPKSAGMKNLGARAEWRAELPKGSYASLRVTSLLKYSIRAVAIEFADVPLP